MELEGYSWPTCSKQPQLVDCRIGVVNKLDRRHLHAQNQLVSASHFDTISACDGRTDRHMTTAYTALA